MIVLEWGCRLGASTERKASADGQTLMDAVSQGVRRRPLRESHPFDTCLRTSQHGPTIRGLLTSVLRSGDSQILRSAESVGRLPSCRADQRRGFEADGSIYCSGPKIGHKRGWSAYLAPRNSHRDISLRCSCSYLVMFLRKRCHMSHTAMSNFHAISNREMTSVARNQRQRRMKPPSIVFLCTVVLATAALLIPVAVGAQAATAAAPSSGTVLFHDDFSGVDGLITNEYAYWSRNGAGRVSAQWEVTSGSLFRRSGAGYSGVPDGMSPGPTSKVHTDSAIFRMNTRAHNFGDVLVGFDLRIDELVTTQRTPSSAFDGVHIWLRHVSEFSLYAISVDRRDGEVVIKKKCPGGPSNDGTYYTLAHSGHTHHIALGKWEHVAGSVANQPDGSVVLRLYRGGTMLLVGRDTGQGCAPIRSAGAVGVRGDNAQFLFDNFVVTQL